MADTQTTCPTHGELETGDNGRRYCRACLASDFPNHDIDDTVGWFCELDEING